MQMTNEEIIRRYKAAGDDKRRMIRILSELNACPKENIRQILREAGLDVPATGNRYTKKKGAEASEESGSKRKQAKLTEKGKRLLKNEEPTECSDLSTPDDVGTCQQNVGTMSEDHSKRAFGDSLEAKKAALTCCQPAEPVDVWEENPRDITLDDLLRLIDPNRDGDERLAIMDGASGKYLLVGPSGSPFWDDMGDYVVRQIAGPSFGTGGEGIRVWLGEKKQRRAKA